MNRTGRWHSMTVRTASFFMATLLLAACTETSEDPVPEPAPSQQIIISGASGALGGQVVAEMLAHGIPPGDLILVSRTPEELSHYADLGSSVRFGDFTQPESLDSAYAGGTKLLLISLNTVNNPNPQVSDQRAQLHQTAIRAAVDAGVQHIVYTSFVDAEENESPIAVDHRATEAMLRESGVSWTSLRNGWYMDRLVQQAAEIVAAGEVAIDPEDGGTAFITRDDLALAAAAVLSESGHENRTYELTGSERVNAADLANMTADIAGVAIEISEAEDGLSLELDSGDVQTTDFRSVTGRDPVTARQLLEANRRVIQGRS